MQKKTKFIRFTYLNSSAGFRIAALLGLLLGIVFLSVADTSRKEGKQTSISIESTPITQFDLRNPSLSRFGALVFRGGLVLTSSYKHFGGVSAIRVQQDGMHFIALSDRAYWLRGQLIYDRNAPAGIRNAEMAPILNSKGKPSGWDTESIAADGSKLYVGIERENSIVRFDYGRKGLLAVAEPVPVPKGVKDLPSNKGMEALVFVPGGLPLRGTLIALSERGLDKSGNLRAFLIGGPNPGSFSVRRTQDYDISDAALLPNGDLLILERKLTLLERFSMRIRRIHLSQIRPDAIVDGHAAIEADSNEQIDNMEGLSVHRTGSGAIVLTLISDDNYSPLQRTLLLQFTISEKEIG